MTIATIPRKVCDIDWQNWRAADPATLLFIIQEGRILLIRKKRGLGAGKINGPGGKQEAGETIEACAIREVQEELCITPGNIRYHGDNCFQFLDGYSIHVHVFTATDYDGVVTETEEAVPLWADLDAIPYSEMWEDDQYWMPVMLSNRLFTGRYIFDGDRMVDMELVLHNDNQANHPD